MFLVDLAYINHKLYKNGFIAEAKEVNDLIKSAVNIPRAVEDFWNFFRQNVMLEITNPASPIDEGVLNKLDEIAKMVLTKYNFNPSDGSKMLADLQDSASNMANSILALEENIAELDAAIPRINNPKGLERLEKDKTDLLNRMKALYDKYNRMSGLLGNQHRAGDEEIAKRVSDILARRRKELSQTYAERMKERVDRTVKEFEE